MFQAPGPWRHAVDQHRNPLTRPCGGPRTPDDVGGLAGDDPQLQHRARQNVVYEIGWFHGRLGRGRVIALLVDDIERPSDISGVLYIRVDDAGAWKLTLGRELRNAGVDADSNNLR